MRDISCLVSPIPGHAFFQKAVFQGEVGYDLLQSLGLAPQVLDLVRGRRASRVAGEPLLASLEELLRPAVVHGGGDAFATAELGDALLTSQTLQHDADLVFSREVPARRPPD